MRILKTADLHLTTNPQDEYRWRFFDWLREKVTTLKIDRVDILGDLTDKKDVHSESLVNRVVEELTLLSSLCPNGVIVLQGNHDYIEVTKPFFRFISKIPKLNFISVPTPIDGELFLPSTRNPEQDWTGFELNLYKIINIHQPVRGSIVGSYVLDRGLNPDFFGKYNGKVLSGDIHYGQTVNKVEYIGAPYHIDFGDKYDGKVMIVSDNRYRNIFVPSIRKLTLVVTSQGELLEGDWGDVREGDQVKVVIRLMESELYRWHEMKDGIKRLLSEKKVVFYSILFEKTTNRQGAKECDLEKPIFFKEQPPEQIFAEFIVKEKLDKETIRIGELLLWGK